MNTEIKAPLEIMQGVQQNHKGELYRVGYDANGTKFFVPAPQCVDVTLTEGTFMSHTLHAVCTPLFESTPTIPVIEPAGWRKDRYAS